LANQGFPETFSQGAGRQDKKRVAESKEGSAEGRTTRLKTSPSSEPAGSAAAAAAPRVVKLTPAQPESGSGETARTVTLKPAEELEPVSRSGSSSQEVRSESRTGKGKGKAAVDPTADTIWTGMVGPPGPDDPPPRAMHRREGRNSDNRWGKQTWWQAKDGR